MAKTGGGLRNTRPANSVKQLEEPNFTVSQVYNELERLNPYQYYGGNVGTTERNSAFERAEDYKKLLPADTLAYKILDTYRLKLSDNQKWAIAYELMKSQKYIKEKNSIISEIAKKAALKKASSVIKLATNKAASQSALNLVKQSGKNLTDYYKWLNKSGNKYRKEYFNKKYTVESVNEFLLNR